MLKINSPPRSILSESLIFYHFAFQQMPIILEKPNAYDFFIKKINPHNPGIIANKQKKISLIIEMHKNIGMYQF